MKSHEVFLWLWVTDKKKANVHHYTMWLLLFLLHSRILYFTPLCMKKQQTDKVFRFAVKIKCLSILKSFKIWSVISISIVLSLFDQINLWKEKKIYSVWFWIVFFKKECSTRLPLPLVVIDFLMSLSLNIRRQNTPCQMMKMNNFKL